MYKIHSVLVYDKTAVGVRLSQVYYGKTSYKDFELSSLEGVTKELLKGYKTQELKETNGLLVTQEEIDSGILSEDTSTDFRLCKKVMALLRSNYITKTKGLTEEKKKVEKAINKWYHRGFAQGDLSEVHGEWGGSFHFISEDILLIERGNHLFYHFYIDFGSCYHPQQSLNALEQMLKDTGCNFNQIVNTDGDVKIFIPQKR